MTIEFNDRIGRRGRHHKNLLVIHQQVIIEFAGETIPGVVRVLRKEYVKEGKWSHTIWTCELEAGVVPAVVEQDWETGAWLVSQTWGLAIAEFRTELPESARAVADGVIERAVRAIWPRIAARLDAEAAESAQVGPSVAELIAAQEELAAAHREAAEWAAAQERTEEASALRQRAASVRDALAQAQGGRMSLADLQAMLAGGGKQ